jgi:hypothetical protein
VQELLLAGMRKINLQVLAKSLIGRIKYFIRKTILQFNFSQYPFSINTIPLRPTGLDIDKSKGRY